MVHLHMEKYNQLPVALSPLFLKIPVPSLSEATRLPPDSSLVAPRHAPEMNLLERSK